MNIKSFDHLYKESRSLTLSNIRLFSDGGVQLDSKELREGKWSQMFSSAIYAKGVLGELVPPVVSDVLTIGQNLDISQDSWSLLELDVPPPPPPPGQLKPGQLKGKVQWVV